MYSYVYARFDWGCNRLKVFWRRLVRYVFRAVLPHPTFTVTFQGTFEGVAHVALFIPNLRQGGAERVAVTLVNILAKVVNVEVVVLENDGGLFQELSTSVRVVHLHTKDNRLRSLLLPTLAYVNQGTFRQAICFLAPWHHLVPLSSYILDNAVPVTFSVRGYPPSREEVGRWRYSIERTILTMSLKFSDRIVPISAALENHLQRHYDLDISRSVVIHNPVSTVRAVGKNSALDSGTMDWWKKPGFKRVLAVGNLRRIKDHATLLQAFALVVRRVPAKLLILGRGSQKEPLSLLIRELGLEDYVCLGGYVENISGYHAVTDLLVHSSLTEGFSNAVLEALAHGINVVTTASGGPEEILAYGEYGRVVPVAEPAALAEAVLAALDAPLPADLLIARAKAFTVETFAQKWASVLGIASCESVTEAETPVGEPASE